MIVSKTFEFNIPFNFLHKDVLTPTKQSWEYIGDDKIYVYVDKITNILRDGALDEDMYNDGRPVPLDVYVIEINPEDHPLICSLIQGPGKKDNEFEMNRPEPSTIVDSVEGYPEYVEFGEFHPFEVYDRLNIKYDPTTGEFELKALYYTDILQVDELTWDMLREKRDAELKATDGMESGDMPQAMIDELRAYRQKLRDWPNVMADKDPWIAYNMFPQAPSWF